MSLMFKLKRLVTGERVNLTSGEVMDHMLRLAETPDPTPIAPPIDYKREPTIFELVKQKVLEYQVNQLTRELGAESPEEAEDFDVGDPDYDTPSSPYEFERHEEELRESMQKLEAFQSLMQAKYPDRYPQTEPGGEGGTAPLEKRASAAPKGPKGPPAAKPPSGDPLDAPDEQ